MKPRLPAPRMETALLAAIHSRALQRPPRPLRPHAVEAGGAGDDGAARLLRIDPPDGAVCVFRDTLVVARFSRPLDRESVGPTTFRVWDDRAALAGRVRLSPDASVLIWEPESPLAANTHHFVVSSGLLDVRGREVTGQLSRFLTCDFVRRDISG